MDVVGCNCSAGPKVMLETIEKMVQYTGKPLSAMPNAGHPSTVEGRKLYLCSPEYMAQYARRFLWAGVRIVGGCCGTTPEHIRLLARRGPFAPGRAPPVRRHCRVEPAAAAQALREVPVAAKSRFGAKLAEGKFVTLRGDPAPARRGRQPGDRRREALRRSTASTASTCPTDRAPARA